MFTDQTPAAASRKSRPRASVIVAPRAPVTTMTSFCAAVCSDEKGCISVAWSILAIASAVASVEDGGLFMSDTPLGTPGCTAGNMVAPRFNWDRLQRLEL